MIATRSGEVYLRGIMAARLIRLLTMFALLLAPLTMVGEHAAMAMPAAQDASAHHAAPADQAGHCAKMGGQSEDETTPDSDCLIACAIACSAIPAVGSHMADRPLPVALAQPLSLVGRISGLHPESDPPPPRID
jgi:putative hemolysin